MKCLAVPDVMGKIAILHVETLVTDTNEDYNGRGAQECSCPHRRPCGTPMTQRAHRGPEGGFMGQRPAKAHCEFTTKGVFQHQPFSNWGSPLRLVMRSTVKVSVAQTPSGSNEAHHLRLRPGGGKGLWVWGPCHLNQQAPHAAFTGRQSCVHRRTRTVVLGDDRDS